MARISTGKSEGVMTRATSQRLLGGMPQMSTGGAIATDQLAAAALQPQAQPVNTFIQTGAPTLGGPVRVPELPAPPRPNQDMAALADALGSFNPVLRQVGASMMEMQKQRDEQAKLRGSAFAQQVSQVGMFTSLQDLQKHLEKGVAEGAAGYDNMFKQFQSLDPRSQRYALVAMQTAALDTSIATAPERWTRTRSLPDGRPRESVAPNDPVLQQSMAELVNPGAYLPEVWASRQSQISAMYGGLANAQVKEFAGHKTRQAKAGLAAERDSAGAMLVVPTNPAQVAAKISAAYNGFYEASGQTTEEFRKEKDSLVDNTVDSVLLAAGGDYNKLKQGRANLLPTLAQVQIGPPGPDGARPLLFAEEGEAGFLRAVEKIDKRLVEMQDLGDRVDRREALEDADVDIARYLTPDVMRNPEALVRTVEELRLLGVQKYGTDTEKFNAYMERVNSYSKGVDDAVLAPVQRDNAFNLRLQITQNPDVDYTAQIVQLREQRLISDGVANDMLQVQRSRNEQKNRLNYDHLRRLDGDLTKRLEAQYMRGDGLITPQEFKQIQEARNALLRRGTDMIMKAQGNDITEQLSGVWEKGVTAMMESGAQRPAQTRPATTPQEIRKQLAPGSRGNQTQNSALQTRLQTEQVIDKKSLQVEIDNLDAGKPLSEDMKFIIRRSGLKPSDVLLNQMKLHNITVPPEVQDRMRQLDDTDLVSQAQPIEQPNRFLALANRLSEQMARGVVNTIIPPAAAAERGIGPFTGSPVRLTGRGFNALLSTIRSGEGGWNSVNRGTTGDSRPIGNLTTMPIGVVENMQSRGRVFAVGAYQFTPGVLTRARKEAGLSPNAPFTPENQSRMATALILGSKRPALADYIRGKSDDLNAAHREIALEWAALQGPSGRGMYDGDKAGNMASIRASQVRAALQEARRAYLMRR